MNDQRSEAVIAVTSLGVRYGRCVALQDVSLRVAPGAVYALLGRNGAGKSSLVKCLLGHRKPSAGRIALFGHDSWRHRRRAMAHLGVVPEEPDAPPSMTARQLGRFSCNFYPKWQSESYLARLRRFEVPLDTAFGRLSKGERAQVMLSLALAPQPRLLVLDDPTLGLDAVARRAVYEELVVELADRDLTVFLTSHDLPGIESIATRVAVLRAGRLLLDEPLESLKQRFRRLDFVRVDGQGERGGDGSDLLEGFEPLQVKARGRGVEALVARFDEPTFERLRRVSDVDKAEVWPASLEEIVIAVTEAAGKGGAR